MKKYILVILLTMGFSFLSFSQGLCTGLDAGEDVTIGCTSDCTVLIPEIGVELMADGSDTFEYIIRNDYCLPEILPPDPTGISSDDDWSGIIDIGFSFGFFGNVYNQLLIGDNGIITFDLTDAGGYCSWNFGNNEANEIEEFGAEDGIDDDEQIPSTNLQANAIFGAYHDLLIDGSGATSETAISYYTAGLAPFRMFVVDYSAVPMYNCEEILTTQQIVLYETSNIIAINLSNKAYCDWEEGAAIVGIQNKHNTIAYTPGAETTPEGYPTYPERNNMVPDSWVVSEPETWQFIPANLEEPEYTFKWYNATTGELLSTEEEFEVCPTETTTYSAELAVGEYLPVTDTITVTVVPSEDATTPDDLSECTTSGTASFDLEAQTDLIIGEVADATITYFTTLEDAEAGTPALTSPYETAITTTIFARMDVLDSSCYDIVTFILNVDNITATDTVINECSEDGSTIAHFDLSDVESIIIGTETGTVTYYESEADAVAGSSPLSSTIYSGETNVLFARLENADGCVDVATIELIVDISPVAHSVTVDPVCNEGFGIGHFDLTSAFETVVGDQTGIITSFHKSEIDAVANTSPLTGEEELASQTIFVRMDNGTCTTYSQFNVEVENCPPFVPNTFTPNADSKNDTFMIGKLKNVYPDYKLSIYNRWGNLVYEEENGDEPWDGKVDGVIAEDPSGTTYFYVLELNDGVNDPIKGWVFVKP